MPERLAMIYVNDTFHSLEDIERRQRQFEQIPALRDCHGQRFGVCLADPVEWIALCLYLKAHGGSAFPMHSATPLKAAQRLAERAHCHQLLFLSVQDPIAVSTRGKDEEPVLVQMSSGTTGEPKCIERTWAAIDREIEAYVSHFTQAQDMQPVIACPVTHSYGLICGVLVALRRQLTPVIVTNINPKYVLRKLREYPRSLLYSSPAQLHTLISLLAPGQRLHGVMTSGTIMPRQWFEALRDKTEHCFQQYGCSEAGCIAINRDMQAANAIGQPLPHVRVTAGNGPDAPSEIQVVSDGRIICTRDLGYFDPDGTLHFLARLDDTINVGGINVYPQEVEDVFLQRPEIRDAVVYK